MKQLLLRRNAIQVQAFLSGIIRIGGFWFATAFPSTFWSRTTPIETGRLQILHDLAQISQNHISGILSRS